MNIKEKTAGIFKELKSHAPFTLLGAVAGIAFMIIFRNIDKSQAGIMFGIFHPSHVFLSAMVTASVFVVHYQKKNFIKVLLVGYFGSIGVATLSDSVVPYIGEKLFSLNIPTHHHHHDTEADHDHDAALTDKSLELDHDHDHDHLAANQTEHAEDQISELTADHEHDHDAALAEHSEHHHKHSTGQLHLGFVEEWYIVHPAAILGIIFAWFIPRSKCPHAAHVLISTWASSAHILMHSQVSFTPGIVAQIFGILFIAVWLPCCISDIVFPMLFVDTDLARSGMCACHSHAHHKKEKHDE